MLISDPRASMLCPKGCGSTCPLPTEGIFSCYLRANTQNNAPFYMLLEGDLTRCVQCKAMPASLDAVLDAVRLGQEALDKAAAIQFKGN